MIRIPHRIFSMALLLAIPSAALAADPSSGTLTSTSGALTYTGGPYFVPNPSPQAGVAGEPPVCEDDGVSCDRFELTVDLPANYDVTNPLDEVQVSVAWPDPTADFDLYIFDEEGREIATSAGSADPEVARFLAGKGSKKYIVQAIPFAPLGQSIEGVVSLLVKGGGGGGGGGGPVLPPAASGQPPRFITYASPPGLGDGAGEPTLGWNSNTQRVMYVAGTETDRVTFPDLLTPAQPQACDALWENVTDPVVSAATVDPILETEQISGRTFVSHNFFGPNALFGYTDDDGESWIPASASPPNGGTDHQTVGLGPYPADSPFAALYDYAVYFCSQTASAGAMCSRSDNGGTSFGPGVPIRTPEDCGTAGGIHGHLQVAPDGTAYVPLRTCTRPDGSGVQAISVSTDAGLTWTVQPIPATEPAQKDPAVGVASDGTIYACYEAPDHSAHVAVSTDRGATWSKDYNISARVGVKTARFVTAVAGDPDRAACAFIGTETAGNSEALDFPGFWYGYVAMTYDGGETWHTVNVTPGDPLQGAGGVCVSGIACTGNNRNLLDFNDIIRDERGMTMFAYADGCIGNCVQDPSVNSFSDNGVIARQTGGRGLLAEFDGDAIAKPKNACLAGIRNAKVSKLNWRAPDNGGAEITNYKVFRSSVAGTPGTFLADAGAKLSYDDATADPAVEKYYYTVVAQNAVGSSTDSNLIELPVVPELPVESPCSVPGVTVTTDPAGDAMSMQGFHDILSVSAAEPDNLPGKIVFTMKVASLAPLPPNQMWIVRFNAPTPPENGDEAYFVAMHTEGGTTPKFVHGTSFVQDATASSVTFYSVEGDIDATSAFAPDGTITLVADKSLFGNPTVDQPLSQIIATTRPIATTDAPIGGGSQDTADTGGSYRIRAEQLCAVNTAPLAALGVDVSRGVAPVKVRFTISGSDADNEALQSYSLAFGDGQSVTDQPFNGAGSVQIEHTYTQVGAYGARLTVTDARGLASSNTDLKMIEVLAKSTPVDPTGPAPAAGRFGGSLGTMLLLPMALFAIRRRLRR